MSGALARTGLWILTHPWKVALVAVLLSAACVVKQHHQRMRV